jgi:hypothetical protein
MKTLKITLITILLSVVGIVFAQDPDREARLFAKLKSKFESDSWSYEQFRNIGKCRCIDTLTVLRVGKIDKNIKLYYQYHADVATGIHPLSEAIFDEAIISVLDRFYSENISQTIEHLSKLDEKYNVNRSPYLICETMYTNG